MTYTEKIQFITNTLRNSHGHHFNQLANTSIQSLVQRYNQVFFITSPFPRLAKNINPLNALAEFEKLMYLPKKQ